MAAAQIIYDARESRSVNDDMFQRYTEVYNKKYGYNITFQKKQITTNDFIITVKGKLYAVIERKTIPDFCGSIINNRLDAQMNDLLKIRQSKGCRVFLLLEGGAFFKQTTRFRNFTFQQIDAKKRSIMGKGIPILHSKDSEYTVEQIVLLAADACRDFKTLELPNRANMRATLPDIADDEEKIATDTMNLAFSLMTSKLGDETEDHKKIEKETAPDFEGTLDIIAELREKYEAKIANDFNKIRAMYAREMVIAPEVEDVAEIPVESLVPKCATPNETLHQMWCAIPSVSNKSAPMLAKKYTLKEFIAAPNAEEIATLEFDSGKKFGMEKAAKIVKAVGTKLVQIKIISQVRSVTPVLAKKLLEDFTFDKLDTIGPEYKYKNKRIQAITTSLRTLLHLRLTA